MSSNSDNTTSNSENSFNIDNIKLHVDLINKLINKLELGGKTEAFDFELEIMTTYPEFYDRHPFLVKKLCKRDDISMLYKMFENLNEIESGNKTLDNVELNLGEDLAQSYLYPCLKK